VTPLRRSDAAAPALDVCAYVNAIRWKRPRDEWAEQAVQLTQPGRDLVPTGER
jgi:hypothetical protein